MFSFHSSRASQIGKTLTCAATFAVSFQISLPNPLFLFLSQGKWVFTYQNQKYEIIEDIDDQLVGEEEYGCRLISSHAKLPKSTYRKANGLLSEDAVEKAEEQFGANIFELPLPSFIKLFKEQLISPIVIFQLLCSGLWAIDTYWKYTLFTLGSIFVTEASTAFQRRQSMMKLRNLSGKIYNVLVWRRKQW